jgi:hypothetical protein
MTANEALAEAWASIDGKLKLFWKDKKADDYGEGYYEGYLTDAAELEKRLLARGYKIVPDPSGCERDDRR